MTTEPDCLDCIDGFQMPIKPPTSGGQAHDQEAVVQQTFHFVRNSFFSLSALACILYTAALNTGPNSCPLEVKPRPIYIYHPPDLFSYIAASQTWVYTIIHMWRHAEQKHNP